MAHATDTFTRANETPLGGDPTSGNWTETRLGVAAREFNLSSNAVATPSNDGEAFWNANSFGADQYSQAVFTCSSGAAGAGPGLFLRGDGTVKGYRVVFSHAASNNVEFGRIVSSAYTFMEAFTQSWSDGDTWAATVAGAANAAVVKIYLNGTLVHTCSTDTSNTVTANGSPGISFSSTATGTIDNWEGGDIADFGGGGTFVPRPIYSRLQAVGRSANF